VKLTQGQQQAVLGHLIAADFELRVASGFECLKGTTAHDNLKSAIQQAQCAICAVKETAVLGQPVAKMPPPGEGLPLTRKQRLGQRWM
jgi:hypothetical protein